MPMQKTFEPAMTVFMLVKTTPEWLGFTVERRNELARTQLTPILEKHSPGVEDAYSRNYDRDVVTV